MASQLESSGEHEYGSSSGWPKCAVQVLMVAGGFVVLFAALFGSVIFSGCLLAPGDAWLQSIPAYFCRSSMWSQLLLCGFPIAADPQIQTWYPLRYLFGSAPMCWNLYVLSAYVMAACFSCGCVLSMTGSRLAGVIGGITYAMSGFLISNLCHTPMIHSAAYLPLIVWVLTELNKQLSAKWYAIGCIAIALDVVAGSPQCCLYTFGVSAAYALWICRGLAPRAAIKFLLVGLAMFAAGCALGAVQWLPTAELSYFSTRGKLSFDAFGSYNLTPIESAGMCFPLVFGGPAGSPFPVYFGSWNMQTASGYIGFLPLMLATIAVLSARYRSAAGFWAVVALLSFLLALGNATPLSALAYHTPGFGLFRCPTRHFLEMTLAMAILAGLGTSILQHKEARAKQVAAALVVTWGVMIVALSNLIQNSAQISKMAALAASAFQPSCFDNPAISVPLMLIAVSTIALVVCWRSGDSRVLNAVLPAVLLVQLGYFAIFCPWRFDHPSFASMRMPKSFEPFKAELNRTHQRLFSARWMLAASDEILPNLSRLWDVPSAIGYEQLMLSRYMALMATPAGSPRWPTDFDHHLDIMSVRYVTVPQNSSQSMFRPNGPGDTRSNWKEIGHSGDAVVYENRHAMPRAWLASQVELSSPGDILKTIVTGANGDGSLFDPHITALIEEPFNTKYSGNSVRGDVTINHLTDTVMSLTSRCDTPGFLVVSDTDFPGWTATVDGLPARIFQTDFIFRGLPVPAGTHSVVFKFQSESVRLGILIALAGLVIAVIVIGILTIRRRISID